MQILNNQNGIEAIENGERIDYRIQIIYLNTGFPTLKDLKEKFKMFSPSSLYFTIRSGQNFIYPKAGHGLASFINYKPFELLPLKGKWKLLFQNHVDTTQTFSITEAIQTYIEPVIYIVEEEYEIPNGPAPKTYKRIEIAKF